MKVGDWIVIIEESTPDENWIGGGVLGKKRQIKRIEQDTWELVVFGLLSDVDDSEDEWFVAPHCARLLTPLETVLL